MRIWRNQVSHIPWKTVSQFLIRLNRLLSYNPAATLLHINSRKMKTYVYKQLCTLMSTEALLMKASNYKTIRMSFPGWMVKHTLAYTYGEILLRNKKGLTIGTCNSLDGSWVCYTEGRRTIPRTYMLYESTYITFLKWQNYIYMENRLVVTRGWEWWWRGQW